MNQNAFVGRRGHSAVLMVIVATLAGDCAFARLDDDPPLGPSGPSISPWNPVNENWGPGGACGFYWFDDNGVTLETRFVPRTLVPRGLAGPAKQNFYELGLRPPAMKTLEGRFDLVNFWLGFFCIPCGSAGPLDAVSGRAERIGQLYWLRDDDAGSMTTLPTRLRMTSTGKVSGSIMLSYGFVFGGETWRSASGGLKAEMTTSGDAIGPRIAAMMANSRTLAQVNPNATHSSPPQSSGVGMGLTIGADNGGSASVAFQVGGNSAEIELNESLRCIAWDCVAPDPSVAFQWWYFTQEAEVLVDAALYMGQHSKVRAKAEFEEFKFEAMQCPSCVPLGGSPGLEQTSGSL